jgi:rRNA maturation endonuclease Nob1
MFSLISILFTGDLTMVGINLMNHRKHKQAENARKPKKEKYNPYANDPPDAKCPYCGESGKICSYINSVSRGWGRGACKIKHS